LKEYCDKTFEKFLACDNALDMLKLAKLYNLVDGLNAAKKFISLFVLKLHVVHYLNGPLTHSCLK
jgi:hypothetical protein